VGRGPRRAGAGDAPPGRDSPPRPPGFFFRFLLRSERAGPPGLPPLPGLPEALPPDSPRGVGLPEFPEGPPPSAGLPGGSSESRRRSEGPGSAE